jgi:uncharacterized membrane protein
VLLLLFGLGWLRKAVLRAAGLMALHDETAIFERERTRIGTEASGARSADWLAGMAAFKAVLLEGLEVVFIVLAVGAGRGLMLPAAAGALAAFVVVMAVGLLIHKPLAKVPENTLKFGVGVMLSSFGSFWGAEGAGAHWPGGDAALLAIIPGLALVSIAMSRAVRRSVARASEAPTPASGEAPHPASAGA